METQWIIIGNPNSRRVVYFQEALSLLGQPEAEVVPYRELIQYNQLNLVRLGVNQPRKRYVIRIESPGEDEDTERLLIGLGFSQIHEHLDRLSNDAPERNFEMITPGKLAGLPSQKGRILCPRQWYLGFRYFLHSLQEYAESRPQVQFMNLPKDIATMFDKWLCGILFSDAGIPTPQVHNGIGDYDRLLETMRMTGRKRMFVKLAYGSSASGVVALEVTRQHERAITSMEMVPATSSGGIEFYNSLRIRTYTDSSEIRTLINWLIQQGVQIEDWIPKAKIDGRNFDVRYVAIGDESKHRVLRSSDYPMTNLHLGNQREADWPDDPRIDIQQIEKLSQKTKDLFPNSLYAGVDICLDRTTMRPYVLEINAFGDLLPGIRHDGYSTYEAEITAQLEQIRQTQEAFIPSTADVPPVLLALRYDLLNLEWYAKGKAEIESGDYPDSFSEEVLLASSIAGENSIESRMIYADWLEERGIKTAVFAQRLMARGAQWKPVSMSNHGGSFSVSQIGLSYGGQFVALIMRENKGYRCWKNISESNHEHCGVQDSIEDALLLIFEALEIWVAI